MLARSVLAERWQQATIKDHYMSIEAIITMAESYARQEGWDEGYVKGKEEGRAEGLAESRAEGHDEAREEIAQALIEDARQNHKDLADLLATLKVIFKDQAYIDKMLAKYYYKWKDWVKLGKQVENELGP